MYHKKYHQGGLTQNGQNVLLSFAANNFKFEELCQHFRFIQLNCKIVVPDFQLHWNRVGVSNATNNKNTQVFIWYLVIRAKRLKKHLHLYACSKSFELPCRHFTCCHLKKSKTGGQASILASIEKKVRKLCFCQAQARLQLASW